jgi:chromosome segregation ATPase
MDSLTGQVSAIVAKHDELERKCAEQQAELEDLRAQNQDYFNEKKVSDDVRVQLEAKIDEKDYEILKLNVLLDNWKTDCKVFKDELTKVRTEYERLSGKHVTAKEKCRNGDAKLALRELQIKNMITIMRRKLATNRVILVALRAAHKVLPTLKEKRRYARILELAKQAPHKDGVLRELVGVLQEAGFKLSWVEPGAATQTPEQTPEEPTNAAAEKDTNMQTSPQEVAN